MRKIFTTAFVFTILMSLLINMSCKKSQDAVEYILTVTVEAGVTGTPESGTYTYKENDQVNYSYSVEAGYTSLIVTLDGTEIEGTGTITIIGNHSLVASAGQGTGEYKLSVSVGAGVTGTPETGTYFYDAGEQVNYSYALEDGYTNLRVTLDGAQVESTGTITISQDHILFAYAEKEYYIQGTWGLTEQYNDGSSFEVTVTFIGDTESGEVFDSDGGTGTYTVDGRSVNFTIYYPEVIYEYTGSFYDEETMIGDAKRYIISESTYERGTWNATKISD
ncbi:MAG: hypothetical protein JSV88_16600 [Candidatus Aminicenantes bacterium]|nr:MAG: hypothetical protein JSV88_16600 [Candidatus Aminicenantes bacterium]